MLRVILLMFLFQKFIFALDINDAVTYNELLPYAEIYKDYNQSENITTIQDKVFQPNKKRLLSFGYSPEFDVWIRFELTNTTVYQVEKVIEYANPLTSFVTFYEGNISKREGGLLNLSSDSMSINPILEVSLEPHQSKTFYIKASSKITTMILKLNLWNPQEFYHKELFHQIIMALFFGAMFITILYNFAVFLATKELSYLYYVLFFTTVSFHHLMYKGVASLYLFSPEVMTTLITYSSVIVALPTIFLALFTQKMLSLEQYPQLNKILNYLLILYPIVILVIQLTEQYQYRSFFFITLLIYLFIVTCYALIKKNIQAYYIIAGWFIYMSSGAFMYLSSKGIYNVFDKYPYVTELSLAIEIVIFSFALATRIKILNQEKFISQKRALLLTELNHRFQNSMQIILSFIFFQKKRVEDRIVEEILKNLENRIIATTELYSLLDTEDSTIVVDTKKYFSSIVDNIKKGFAHEHIEIEILSNVDMNSEYVVYCGLIVNEAVTNAFKYAFEDVNDSKIEITLSLQSKQYHLTIKDNGNGFSRKHRDESLGFYIINRLATLQLKGTIDIKTDNGVEITVKWRQNEK